MERIAKLIGALNLFTAATWTLTAGLIHGDTEYWATCLALTYLAQGGQAKSALPFPSLHRPQPGCSIAPLIRGALDKDDGSTRPQGLQKRRSIPTSPQL